MVVEQLKDIVLVTASWGTAVDSVQGLFVEVALAQHCYSKMLHSDLQRASLPVPKGHNLKEVEKVH